MELKIYVGAKKLKFMLMRGFLKAHGNAYYEKTRHGFQTFFCPEINFFIKLHLFESQRQRLHPH